MKKIATVLLGIVGVAGAFASDATVKETVYTAKIGEEVRTLCQKLGKPVPTNKLVLRSDTTCEIVSLESRKCGHYAQAKDALALSIDGSQDVMLASLEGERVLLNGIVYEKATAAFTPGTWTVRRNGQEVSSIRFTFDPKGTFSFTGMGATSKGTWALDGDTLVLTWTEIDGQNVEDGMLIRKKIQLGEGSFKVDTYYYERQG